MTAKGLGALAAVLLVVGLAVGFVPLSSDGVSCGRALAPRDRTSNSAPPDLGGTDSSGGCHSTLTRARVVSFSAAGFGAALALGVILTEIEVSRRAHPLR